MPRYYCDYCDTYLTHDSPSVRKQHNSGYKHKANVRDYYQQYEAQQSQYLIEQRIKAAHAGQTASFQQIGAAYNQMRPRLPILSTPMMPMPGNPQIPLNSPLIPGIRLPVFPALTAAPPPGTPSVPGPGQVNGPPRPLTMMPPGPPLMVPGSTPAPASSRAPPMFAPPMYQSNPIQIQ